MNGRRSLVGGLLALCAVLALVGPQPAAAAPGPGEAPQWWFDSWQLPTLWAAGARGQGVTIAEIDTGVNAALPELAGKILPGKDFGGADGDGWTDRDQDPFGHGTAMASVMVARPGLLDITGVAPDARVLPLAVPIQGTTDAGAVDQVPEAIRWAADHGAKIISMSLGGRRDPARDTVPCPVDEQRAIEYAVGRGAIVVAAGGNSGRLGSPVEDPGVCLGVVSVGAVDATGDVPPFSSRHPYLTLVAPGVSVASLGRVAGSAYLGEGTSQATAITSAVLALVWSKHPGLVGREVVTRTLATLDRRSATHDPAYGWGLLDADHAVLAATPANAPNPVYDALAPFLRRERAEAAANALPAPSPAASVSRPPGAFQVGRPPGVSGQVRAGWITALVGLAALAGLGGIAMVARRRAIAGPAAAGPLVSAGVAPAGAVPLVASPTPNATEPGHWQDISGPIWPFAPPPPTFRPQPPKAET
jgi:subtilisin family serine protease